MDRATKQATVRDLKDRLSRVQSVVLADYRGLNVESVNTLRRQFEKAACEYRVVKNTLLGLAIKGTPLEALEKLLEGPTAIAYSFEDPAAPAKVAVQYGKSPGGDKLVVKGGFADGQFLDSQAVTELAAMPGKDELRARLLATLNAAASGFVRLLTAAQQNFLYLLQARERSAGGEGGQAEG